MTKTRYYSERLKKALKTKSVFFSKHIFSLYSKHDFEITGDPKGPPGGSTFWWCFEAPDCGATPMFRAKMSNKAQNQDLLTLIDR